MIAHTYPLSGAKVLFKLIGLKSLAHKLRKKISVIRHNHMLNETKIFHTLSPNLLIGITRAFRHLEKNAPHLLENGSYLEFGLFKGFALWFAERISQEFSKDFTLYGFDSFAGLPKTLIDKEEPNWTPGAYACNQETVMNDIQTSQGDLNRIRLTKGFFSKELFANVLKENLSKNHLSL